MRGSDFRFESASHQLFDAYTIPGASEQTFSLSGFIPDEPGILARVLPIDPHTRMRIAKRLRRPTWRHRRLCARDGHPASRLAPEYLTHVTPAQNTDDAAWSVDMRVEGQDSWCQRCGASIKSPE